MINNNSESKRMTKIFEEQDYFTHDLTSTKNNDIIKNKYSKDNNIPLVRIPYWERDKMTLEMLLGKEYLIEWFNIRRKI